MSSVPHSEENENEISNSVTSFMNRLVTVQIPLELLRRCNNLL